MTELSDELLVAYVDGQLARKQARAVEKVLDQDDVIARRANALREAHARLERAFDAILAGNEAEISELAESPTAAVPQTLAADSPAARSGVGRIAMASTVLVTALIAGAIGFGVAAVDLQNIFASAPAAPVGMAAIPWSGEATRAHALVSRESVEVGLDSQANREFVHVQLASEISPTLKFPDLQPQGFTFVRGQLLRDGTEPLGLMLYLGQAGAPLGLYVKRGHLGGLPVTRREGSISAVAWSEAGVVYLLAGEQDQDLLLRLTEKIRHEPLPPPPALPPFASTQKDAYAPPQLSPRPKSTRQASPWNPHLPSPIR